MSEMYFYATKIVSKVNIASNTCIVIKLNEIVLSNWDAKIVAIFGFDGWNANWILSKYWSFFLNRKWYRHKTL